MKKIIFLFIASAVTANAMAQKPDAIINPKEVERIERTLSSDEMQGRKVFTPGIEKAAAFIADEFKAAGLQTWNNSAGYLQEFVMVRPKFISASATIDGKSLDQKDIMVITSQADLTVNAQSGYEKVTIAAGASFFDEVLKYTGANKNYIVLVDTGFSKLFPRLAGLKRSIFKTNSSVVFLLTTQDPQQFEVTSKHEISEVKLANVVGVLPGKSKKDEYVIFSGHYDHLGIGKPVNGDSIYNGANDDAAGTTAVIVLAKYFKALANNERTIIFAAFTAEESGGYGSKYFSTQFDPAKVAAMFNIEMIGTESKWGTNSAFITGYEKTDMGKIMEKNLEGTGFTFYPDPYIKEDLFYRSDNATLARLGVPAHTISTSKMDNEPNYHKPSDEIGTLDMKNMAMIIKAIALSSRSIISGKDSPSRVNAADLKR